VQPRWLKALVAVLVHAAAAAATASDEQPAGVRFRLPAEYEFFSYLGARGGPKVNSRDAFTALPEVEWRPSPSALFRFALALRQDFAEEERSRIYPSEGFLDLEHDGWALRVGRQFITWGRADSLRPTDVFKRHDLTDLIENREEAVDAVKLDLSGRAWTLETVWAPVFDPDTVSFRSENRWTLLPTEVTVPEFGRVQLSFREGRTEPAQTLASGQFGVRVSGSSGGWDFAAMYYYGYDRVPTVVRQELARFDPWTRAVTLTLHPVHKRIHVFGGDWATVMGAWGFRGEAAYTRTSDPESVKPEVDDPYLRFTGGVDRTFSAVPAGQSLLVILQYALDAELPSRGRSNQQEVGGLLHPFRRAFLLNSTWNLTEFVKVRLKGFVNLEDGDYVLQPELSLQPIDAMSIVLGADFLGGARDTFFGRFRDNDRVRMRISYVF
jgi:hypothetical protein